MSISLETMCYLQEVHRCQVESSIAKEIVKEAKKAHWLIESYVVVQGMRSQPKDEM